MEQNPLVQTQSHSTPAYLYSEKAIYLWYVNLAFLFSTYCTRNLPSTYAPKIRLALVALKSLQS